MGSSSTSRETSSYVEVGPSRIPVHQDDVDLINLLLACNDIAADFYAARYNEQITRQPGLPVRSDVSSGRQRRTVASDNP
jgi:hypothetical protein